MIHFTIYGHHTICGVRIVEGSRTISTPLINNVSCVKCLNELYRVLNERMIAIAEESKIGG